MKNLTDAEREALAAGQSLTALDLEILAASYFDEYQATDHFVMVSDSGFSRSENAHLQHMATRGRLIEMILGQDRVQKALSEMRTKWEKTWARLEEDRAAFAAALARPSKTVVCRICGLRLPDDGQTRHAERDHDGISIGVIGVDE